MRTGEPSVEMRRVKLGAAVVLLTAEVVAALAVLVIVVG